MPPRSVTPLATPGQPRPVTLTGRFVELRPLTLDHTESLVAIGLDPDLWRYTVNQVKHHADMKRYIETALEEQAAGRSQPFVIIPRADGRVVGSTRYGNIDRHHRRVEIGWTWVATAWQRTPINTEAKLLLLRHAFESLDCVRVEFKTDRLNEKSRAALRRIGAVEEGVFRRHMITDTGRWRDSVYYSIVAEEWPTIRAGLEAMLAR